MARQSRKIICWGFVAAYLLLIASTTLGLKTDESDIDYLLIVRIVVYAVILLAWLSRVIDRPRQYAPVLVMLSLISPYILTQGYMITVDTVMLFASASSLSGDSREIRRFFARTAYISAFTVTAIAILSQINVLPSMQFEWDTRVKESVGFLNPNTFYYYLFSSAFVMFLLEDILGFLIIGILLVVFYPLVESRTFFAAYLLLLAYTLFGTLVNAKLRNGVLWMTLVGVILIGLFSALFPLIVSAVLSIVFHVDASELLSNRLEIIAGESGPESAPLTVFGGNANFADSLYVYLVSGIGMPFTILAILSAIYLLRRKMKAVGNGRILMAAVAYFTVGCFEVPYSASSMIALFLIWVVVFHGLEGRSRMVDVGVLAVQET
jgi:hypothetical protein